MRTSVAFLGSLGLLALGYLLGASQVLSPGDLFAQPGGAKRSPAAAGGVAVSDDAKTKIKGAADALKSAADALTDDGRYTAATKGVNGFLVLTGGGNAQRDLDNGAVVDPETYAGLYANLAADNVAVELSRDAEGRLTYKGRIVRMYPLSRLRALYAVRAELTGEELLPAVVEAGDRGRPQKKATPAVNKDLEGE